MSTPWSPLDDTKYHTTPFGAIRGVVMGIGIILLGVVCAEIARVLLWLVRGT